VQPGEDGIARLYEGRDQAKDQTYFLHAISQHALGRTLFPLGGLEKSAVRARARARGLANFDRRDSTGICFIGERPFRSFLASFLPEEPGPMRTPEGETVGEHRGLAYYTLGQRQGLGLGGRRGGRDAAWFVIGKDTVRNVLVVAQGEDHPALYGDVLLAADLRWIAGAAPPLPLRCAAKVRHRQSKQACTVSARDDDRCIVRFDEPQRAIAPGQYVVLYMGEECLGGGMIASSADDRL
jgi:tRNA-specific 2-thiouridylase